MLAVMKAAGTLSILVVTLFLAMTVIPFPAEAAAPAATRGHGGAVASDDAYATTAGLEVLAAGGNAVDAAVATTLALAVSFPEAGNLGGGGFAVIRLPDGALAALDFREVAPAAGHRTMFLDAEGTSIPDASLVGPLAAGVPGTPAGLYLLHQRYGELSWQKVVEPARRLAAEGFTVDDNLAHQIAEAQDRLSRFAESTAAWLPEGAPPAVGARLAFPDLAVTLAAYAADGPRAITHGPVAARVEEISRRYGGVLTAADLAAYEPAWREPVRFEAFGWEMAVMGLPSSGAAILGEVFGVLERRGWSEIPRFGAARVHLLTEALRRAFADRLLLGDPARAEATEADLLSFAWLDRRAAAIDPDRATDSHAVHAWPGEPPIAPGGDDPSGETTHVAVVDAQGGAVALTTTLNGLFGSKVWVPGLGFLNNEMDDFTTAPGEPNMFGLIQGEANTVTPGRRMLSSMSPTIAWREAAPGAGAASGPEVISIGGRGGSRIPTNTAQVLLNVIADGDHLQLALDRPRIHHQWLPDQLEAEPDALSPETREALTAKGHRIEVTPVTAKVNAARILPGGATEAAVDPRGPGRAGALADPPQTERPAAGSEPGRAVGDGIER